MQPSDIKLPNTKLFINNQWVNSKSGKTFNTINPYTESVICSVSEGDKEDVDIAVECAREAFENGAWSNTTPSDRASYMNKLADLIDRDREYLSSLESLDNGKPKHIALSYDITQAAKTLRYYAGLADKIHGKTIDVDSTHTTYTLHQAVGVCGFILPWNFPLMLLSWKCGPALAAGCTVVCKQSEITPLTALAFCSLVVEAGFPPGVFNLVSGFGHTVGSAISHHMDIDKISFTGSNRTGRLIAEASAKSNLKKVTLELGGKSPNIVFPDVDIDSTVAGCMSALYNNMGQSCCAGSRLYVHDKIYEEFKNKLVNQVKTIRLGNPMDSNTQHGPLVSKDQFDRVMSYIEKGKIEGKLELGGERHSTQGYFIQPTIFSNVTQQASVCREEIFGPVLVIIPFSSTEQVIKMANDTEYSLASGIWTRDLSTALHVSRKLKAGSVWINEYNQIHIQAPFGDYAGFGKDLSKYAVTEYLAVKSVSISHNNNKPTF